MANAPRVVIIRASIFNLSPASRSPHTSALLLLQFNYTRFVSPSLRFVLGVKMELRGILKQECVPFSRLSPP